MAKAKKAAPLANKSSPGKEKTGLYIQVDILEDLKYIEYRDDKTRTDIVNEALGEYITAWKKRYGQIPKKE